MSLPAPAPNAATAIILARAGSKGVPGKNTRTIAGKPCIAWTIGHAQSAATIGRIAVSSDDPRALDIAQSMGCTPLRRSDALATDTARIDDAAREAVQQLEHAQPRPALSPSQREGLGVGSSGVQPQHNQLPPTAPIVILYANVPVRPAGLIDRAVELLTRTGCDSVQSYQPVGKYHPWWTARLGDDGQVRPWEGDVLNHNTFRRQDLPPAFIPDGAIIALTRRALFCEVPNVPPGPHAFFGQDRRGIINPEGSVIDIDSEMDVLLAEHVLNVARPSGP